MGYRKMRIDVSEPEKYEQELKALAADGILLTWYSKGIAYFEDSGPRNVKYAIKAAKPDSKKLKEYAEAGWHIVSDKSGITIFRNDDPEAPPLSTDPEERAFTLRRHYLKHSITYLIVHIFCGIFPLIMLTYWSLRESKLFYYMTDSDGAPFGSMAKLSIAALVFCIFFAAMNRRELIRTRNAAAEAAAEYRKKASGMFLTDVLVRIFSAAAYILLAAEIFILMFVTKNLSDSEKAEITQSGLPGYVLTADELLDGKEHRLSGSWQEYNDHYLSWGEFYYNMHFTGYSDGHDIPNTAAEFSRTGFTESCYSFEQYLTIPTEPHLVPSVDDSMRLRYAAKCCEFKSDTLAKLYLNERIHDMSGRNREKEYPDMPCADIDEFVYLYTYNRDLDRGDLSDFILFRCGSTVYELCFTYDARNNDSEDLIDAAVNNIRKPAFRS